MLEDVSRRVVVAVLTVGHRYVLQHRDDLPGISWPGYWTLFGGEVEAGEHPREAVRREIREEIGLELPAYRELWAFVNYSPYLDGCYRLTVFAADVGALWAQHELREGQGVGVFGLTELPEPMVPVARALIERYHDVEVVGRRPPP